MEIVMTIPDDVAVQLQNGSNQPLAMRLLELAAIEGYKSGQFTLPQVQAMLGFDDRFELDGFLKAHDVLFDYSPEQLAREEETIKMLQAKRNATG